MDYNPRNLETREYLKLCQKQWKWILDNYDRLIGEGLVHAFLLKDVYFEENDLDEPQSGCYLCELTDSNCIWCPLSSIAWERTCYYPCVNDPNSVYRRISELLDSRRYEEAKDAIKQFLSIIDNECRRW